MVTLLEEKTPKIAQEKNKFRHIPNLSTILPLFRMNTLNDHVGGVSNCDSWVVLSGNYILQHWSEWGKCDHRLSLFSHIR